MIIIFEEKRRNVYDLIISKEHLTMEGKLKIKSLIKKN